MKHLIALTALLFATSLLGACTPSMKSYADPTYRKATVRQLTPLKPPLPVRVEVQFQRRGEPKSEADARLRGYVERTLRSSGVLQPEQLADALLRVVVNNIGDAGEARSAGIKTGLSFGLSGAMVTDQYQFSITYSSKSGKKQEVFFRHALHTAVGGVDLPNGVAPLKPQEAYAQVVEDAVLGALQQMQADGVLQR